MKLRNMNGNAIRGQNELIAPFMYGNLVSNLSAKYPPMKDDAIPKIPEINSFESTYVA